MSSYYFYLQPDLWSEKVVLTGQEAKHLSQVLRLKIGEQITLLDGYGKTGQFTIEKIDRKQVYLTCLECSIVPEQSAKAIIALALSKAVRRSFFIEKAVELGAYAIWIWQADYSQGKLTSTLTDSLHQKMIAGAKQCGNPWLPKIKIFSGGLKDIISQLTDIQYRILPWELQKPTTMLTSDLVGQEGQTIYVIGPEGGFSENELNILDQAQFHRVSLGSRILRCETAATLCLGLHWLATCSYQIKESSK